MTAAKRKAEYNHMVKEVEAKAKKIRSATNLYIIDEKNRAHENRREQQEKEKEERERQEKERNEQENKKKKAEAAAKLKAAKQSQTADSQKSRSSGSEDMEYIPAPSTRRSEQPEYSGLESGTTKRKEKDPETAASGVKKLLQRQKDMDEEMVKLIKGFEKFMKVNKLLLSVSDLKYVNVL